MRKSAVLQNGIAIALLWAEMENDMTSENIWILLDSSGIGGIETHVTGLASALRQCGLQVEIVLVSDHGEHPLMEVWAKAGNTVRIIEGGVIGLYKALNNQRPALVHTHGYKAGILGKGICGFLRIPIISTYHAGEPGAGRVKLYNMLDCHMARLAPAIAVSSPIAKRLRGDVRIIPNFVDVPETMALGGNTIAFVGRLSHEKGADRFLELAAQFPDLPFDVFGDGPERAEIEKTAPENVCMWGSVASMDSYWAGIGLLCISSRHEGLPLVALEAMARGVPVASYAVGALPEVIEDGLDGFIVPAGDQKAMAQVFETWRQMDRSHKTEMSLRARSRIQEMFSTRSVLPQILNVYDQALNSHSGRCDLSLVNRLVREMS